MSREEVGPRRKSEKLLHSISLATDPTAQQQVEQATRQAEVRERKQLANVRRWLDERFDGSYAEWTKPNENIIVGLLADYAAPIQAERDHIQENFGRVFADLKSIQAERDAYWQHLMHNIYSLLTDKTCDERVALGMATSAAVKMRQRTEAAEQRIEKLKPYLRQFEGILGEMGEAAWYDSSELDELTERLTAVYDGLAAAMKEEPRENEQR